MAQDRGASRTAAGHVQALRLSSEEFCPTRSIYGYLLSLGKPSKCLMSVALGGAFGVLRKNKTVRCHTIIILNHSEASDGIGYLGAEVLRTAHIVCLLCPGSDKIPASLIVPLYCAGTAHVLIPGNL